MAFGQHATKLRLLLRRKLFSKASSRKVKFVVVLWACLIVWTAVSFISGHRHGERMQSKRGPSPQLTVHKRAPAKEPPAVMQQMFQTSSFLMPSTGSTVDALGAACFTDKCDGHAADSSAANTTILIGILSEPVADAEFRAAARATWVKTAQELDHVKAVFFFTASSETVQQEANTYRDVVVGAQRHPDMPAAFQMLEHFAEAPEALHILRVDVRSYVSVPRLLAKLEHVCAAAKCRGEDIWAGRQITNKEITNDRRYQEETGLNSYLPYMSSGAYLISMTLAESLSLMHNEIGLKYFGSEDVSMGVWLIPMAARRIDLGTAMQLERPCCFDSWGRMKVNVCTEQAEQLPIVLSVLAKPQYLYKYHNAISACGR